MSDKVTPSRKAKIEAIEKLSDKVKDAKSIVLTDYSGIQHKQLEEFRKAIKGLNAEYSITKNTLLTRALKATDNTPDLDTLEGPTATLFTYKDEVAPLKELVKFFKTTGIGTIKLGLLDGEILQENDVVRLSNLPNKDQLRAQVVSQLAAPLTGLSRALSWNINKLVWTISSIQEQKEKAN